MCVFLVCVNFELGIFVCLWWPNLSQFLIYKIFFFLSEDKVNVRAGRIFQVGDGVSIETLLDEKCPVGLPF